MHAMAAKADAEASQWDAAAVAREAEVPQSRAVQGC
jgi:hypothetical protein